jgi:methionyl-tRNA formyltransferase
MQRALMDGVKETGVSIIEMVLQMDAGDILGEAKIPVPKEMAFGELETKLCDLSQELLLQVIKKIQSDKVIKVIQNPEDVTFAAKILPEEEQIQWEWPAARIHNLIRALSPRPGAWSLVKLGNETKRLKIKRAEVVPHQHPIPAEIVLRKKNDLVVSCGQDALRLLEVQLEGKKALPIEDFLKGYSHLTFLS